MMNSKYLVPVAIVLAFAAVAQANQAAKEKECEKILTAGITQKFTPNWATLFTECKEDALGTSSAKEKRNVAQGCALKRFFKDTSITSTGSVFNSGNVIREKEAKDLLEGFTTQANIDAIIPEVKNCCHTSAGDRCAAHRDNTENINYRKCLVTKCAGVITL